MEITGKEITLAVLFAVIGFFFSTHELISWMSTLNPAEGLVVYYAIIYGTLFILSKLDLVVFGEKIESGTQILGLVLIMFAFFILVDWESAYVQYVVRGNFDVAVNYIQSEDGAIFYLWQQILPNATVETWRLLTFVFTPFILVLIGSLFVSEKIEF